MPRERYSAEYYNRLHGAPVPVNGLDSSQIGLAASVIGIPADIRQSSGLDPHWAATTMGISHSKGYEVHGINPGRIGSRFHNLLDNGDPLFQPYLRSGQFDHYMFELAHTEHGPGPACERVLSAAEQGDAWTFLFGVRHTPQLKEMDKGYYSLYAEPKKPLPGLMSVERYTSEFLEPARELFNARTQEIWDAVADSSDTSQWRQFVLSHFPTVFYGAIFVGDPREYVAHAQKEYERIRGFVENGDPGQFNLLANYLNHTFVRFNGVGAANAFDDDVRNGDFKRFYKYQKLHDRIVSSKTDWRAHQHGTCPENALQAELYWLIQFKEGAIPIEALERMPRTIDRLEHAVTDFTKGFPVNHPVYPHMNYLRQHESLASSPEAILQLLADGILPTDALITLMQVGVEEGRKRIGELREATADGKFDPNDQVQKDLEYLKYLKTITPPYGGGYDDKFSRISFVSERDQPPSLTPHEAIEAKAAAYEAAKLYWMINEGVMQGRNAVVVGNHRYGSLFVTEPLRWHLQKLRGVSQADSRVSSSASNSTTIVDNLFSKYTANKMVQGGDDLWIVDGTKNTFDSGNNCPRFPSAMYGYLNWLLAYNEAAGSSDPRFAEHLERLQKNGQFSRLVERLRELQPNTPYRISMWSPMADENLPQVTIGSDQFPYSAPDFHDEQPQAILANPVIEPYQASWFPRDLRHHGAGYFDDPDDIVDRGEKYAFTRFGLEELISGKTEDQLVQQVQQYMDGSMDEMIRMTSPSNIKIY